MKSVLRYSYWFGWQLPLQSLPRLTERTNTTTRQQPIPQVSDQSMRSLFFPVRLSICFAAFVAMSFANQYRVHADDGTKFFETEIRPVLVERCYPCHSAAKNKQQGGLLLDSRDGIRAGGESGPAVVPGEIDQSLILDAMNYKSFEMPPAGKLDEAVIAKFEQWIKTGATDPRVSTSTTTGPLQVNWEEATQHWAFQPIAHSVAPKSAGNWSRCDVDEYVIAKLKSAGLEPNATAARSTWLRRVTYDLIGLPPTPEELQLFLDDDRPDDYERVVDRLLASPRYGERYGRHWLDLARYADSNGADENHAYPVAWRYRDYVVDAFNSDMPYDQFVIEQLAGDLLPAESEQDRVRQLTATGFLVLGPKMLAEQDKPKLVADLVDEQLDTVGKVFLGLTLGCARCHDHKFDPIRSQDYYSLAGIFYSTKTMENLAFVSQWNERELPNQERAEQIAAHQQQLDQAAKALAETEKELRAQHTDKPESTKLDDVVSAEEKARLMAARELVESLKKSLPSLDRAMSTADGPVKLVAVNLRGNHLQTVGEPLPRSVPTILQSTTASVAFPTEQSGRYELANWCVDPQHPLTARVMVNRLWQYHFGEGLVRSASNFGLRGESPSHPELLDRLAEQFVAQGWSMKALHRRLVLSATYRSSSSGNPKAELVDPDNMLVWRMNRRRLEVEPLRDALLAVADAMDTAMTGQASSIYGNKFEDSQEARTLHDAARRTIYLPINRAALEEFFSTFDYVDSAVSLEKRPVTTVPHQALFLMNHRLSLHAGWKLAHRLERHSSDDAERLKYAYAVCFARTPTDAEMAVALRYLQSQRSSLPHSGPEAATPSLAPWVQLCRGLLISNEFIYVD